MRKFLVASKEGDGLGLAFKLREEGNDVKVYIKEPTAREDFDGLLHKVVRLEDGVEDDRIVVFDSNGGGKTADRLRGRGVPVFMGSVFRDQLEYDRGVAMGLMEEAGIQTPHSETFYEWERGRRYAQVHDGRLAFKPSGHLGEHCMSFVAADSEEMVEMLSFYESKAGGVPAEFELQDFVEGLAVSTEGWFDGNDWVLPFNRTLEVKAMMNGNLGPSGGCSGNVVWACEEDWIAMEGIAKMAPILRHHKYVGPIDLNTIINKEGIWGLEFTPRFGYDALPALLELIEQPIGEIIASFVEGRGQIRLKGGYSSALRVTIPPYPDMKRRADEGIPVRGLGRQDRSHAYFFSVRLNDANKLESTAAIGGAIVAFTGWGMTIPEALAGPYEMAEKLRLPNKEYRTDLTETFEKEYNDQLTLLKERASVEVTP